VGFAYAVHSGRVSPAAVASPDRLGDCVSMPGASSGWSVLAVVDSTVPSSSTR